MSNHSPVIPTPSGPILAINPGSTSTKISVVIDGEEVLSENITYTESDFADCARIADQITRRKADIEALLAERLPETRFAAVVGRGGLPGPVPAGGYLVDDTFMKIITEHPVLEHASNLGGPLAKELAASAGIDGCASLIYDPVTIDEISDVARITGVPGIERKSIAHHLNMRAVARRAADFAHLPYEKANVIVVHMGGGSSACAIKEGRVIDVISDDEVMFSAERSGGVPVKELTTLMKTMSVEEIVTKVRRHSGLAGHLGTTDLREVEARMADGDSHAQLIFDALALQIGKAFAALAASLKGAVDVIAITGGMAHSEPLVKAVAAHAEFIAPLFAYPGECEMTALAEGARRILAGTESAHHIGEYLSDDGAPLADGGSEQA